VAPDRGRAAPGPSGGADAAATFTQLLLPGDLVGLEGLTGAAGYQVRALVASRLQPLPRRPWPGWPLLAEGLGQQQRRGEDLVRCAAAPRRSASSTSAAAGARGLAAGGRCLGLALPTLKDMAAIIDTAPETVSRILGHLRRQHLLDDRQRQVASFSPTRLREVEWPAGMTRTDRNPRRRRATEAWAA
jgi:CRP-like cAMP-binding protein